MVVVGSKFVEVYDLVVVQVNYFLGQLQGQFMLSLSLISTNKNLIFKLTDLFQHLLVFLSAEHHHWTQLKYNLSAGLQKIVPQHNSTVLNLELFSILTYVFI